MLVDTIICTKSNLSKIIKWNNSRDNTHTKRGVIDDIMEHFKKRADIEHLECIYTASSCSEKGNQKDRKYKGSNGSDYKLVIKNGSATLVCIAGGETYITYFLKEWRKQNAQ